MKTQAAILALVCMSAITSSAEWKVETHIDEMTDVLQYIVWTTGTVVQINTLLDYTPQLQLRLTSPVYESGTDALSAKIEMLLVIETEGLSRSGAEVLYRIDNEDAVHEIWSPSTERRGAFSPHPRNLYKKLKNAKTLRIRYITTLGDIRTTCFDVSGIDLATQKIKEELRQLAPKIEQHMRKTEQLEDRIITAAKDYARPKLKNPKTFSVSEVIRHTHSSGDFHLVRFTADGRNLRVGVTIADDGTISIIDKAKLPALLEASKPAKK